MTLEEQAIIKAISEEKPVLMIVDKGETKPIAVEDLIVENKTLKAKLNELENKLNTIANIVMKGLK